MSAPIFSYPGTQLNYTVGTPLSISPVNTGSVPSPRLRITTVSGNSNNLNYPADGTPNVATYKYPNSVASKSDGTLAVVDDWSQTVRVISPSGVSSTIAGKYEVINGVLQLGYADGQGSVARFSNPKAVAYDVVGNIIVLDYSNFRVRKISPSGLVTTFSGSGTSGLSDGTAVTAQFKAINSLWVDNAGNIFVTDDNRIRKVDVSGNVTTIAGSVVKGNTNGNGLTASFRTLRGITGDNLGNLYVSDTDNSSIRKIDSLGNVTTIVTGISPSGIGYYSGTLIVADVILNQLLTVVLSNNTYSVFVGSGIGQFKDAFDTRVAKTGAALYAPEGIAIDSSGASVTVYVADKNSMKIRKTDYANYTINPALPLGLTLDSITGVISGTPTQSTTLVTYTITAANNSGYGTSIIGFQIN